MADQPIPPDGLIILEPDFERLYDERGGLLPRPDRAARRPRPAPPHRAGRPSPRRWSQRLLDGPSAALAAGVRNPLAGVELRSAVTVDGQTAIVDLTGADRPTPRPLLAEICAQLVWTLTQLDEPRIRSVEIRVDGEPVDLDGVPDEQTVDDWAAFDPDAVPVDGVGPLPERRRAAHRHRRASPRPGRPGPGAYGLTSAAVAADAAQRRAVLPGRRPRRRGRRDPVRRPVRRRARLRRSTRRTLSAPTRRGDPAGGLGRARRHLGRAGAGRRRRRRRSARRRWPGSGRPTVLQLSPDGVRAALVVDGPGGPGALRRDGRPRRGRRRRPPRPPRDRPGAVAGRRRRLAGQRHACSSWPGTRARTGSCPTQVGVDGWGLADVPTAGLPSQPTSIAAAPDPAAAGQRRRRPSGSWPAAPG